MLLTPRPQVYFCGSESETAVIAVVACVICWIFNYDTEHSTKQTDRQTDRQIEIRIQIRKVEAPGGLGMWIGNGQCVDVCVCGLQVNLPCCICQLATYLTVKRVSQSRLKPHVVAAPWFSGSQMPNQCVVAAKARKAALGLRQQRGLRLTDIAGLDAVWHSLLKQSEQRKLQVLNYCCTVFLPCELAK